MASRWVFFIAFLWTGASYAESAPQAGPSASEIERILRDNARVAAQGETHIAGLEVDRPVAEYEEAAYFLINGDFSWDSYPAKTTMVKNLPRDLTAVIVVASEAAAASARATFSPLIEEKRLLTIVAPAGAPFWARDAFPLPVHTDDKRIGLVDARYHKGIEPDQVIASYFKVPLFRHQYTYEGGNFAADRRGNCISVNQRISSMSDAVFKQYYGCKKMLRLPFSSGIGHVDEHAKFLSDDIVITDVPSYAEIFEKLGYEVHVLPRPGAYYETYVNSLLVNGTVFMPSYGKANDAVAQSIYERLGYKVVPLSSRTLSNNGLGSIHCITMTYPKMAIKDLVAFLGAR